MLYPLPARCRKTWTACKKRDSETARCLLQRNVCFRCGVKTLHCVRETQFTNRALLSNNMDPSFNARRDAVQTACKRRGSTTARRLLPHNSCIMRGPKTTQCAQETLTITTQQWESYIYLFPSSSTTLWQSFSAVTKYVKLPESDCYTDDEWAHNNFRY